MPILKCKMCGGDIVLDEEKTFGTCEYCGSTMTLPKVSDEQRAALFNRGNHFRRAGDFDKALAIYENIVREDDTDAEAHWCCVLCRFGIEYVEDPNTYEFVPTCHRASFDSILEDVDYLAAIEHSDGITRRQYQKDAAKIAEVQKGILATSQNEEPFDIFICYKETDDATKQRTKDSLDAQEIYYQLTNEGYRVFFSRITLEDKAGAEYEPYIFAALNSAKIMVVIGSKPDYFNAVWVKNEWSRFLALMRKDRSKLLLPCYKGMDPYDLPEALSVLQSYDMAKIGFIQDLIRGIKKVIKTDEPKKTAEGMFVAGSSASIAPLLKRAFMFLEDGNWQEADAYCEKVLDQDPENAQAYLGKLMAELKVRTKASLLNCDDPFDSSSNYLKLQRFADKELADEVSGYVKQIYERNENARIEGIYANAVYSMNVAADESAYISAAGAFKRIAGYKDADVLAEQCLEKAEEKRKDAEQEAEERRRQAEIEAEEQRKAAEEIKRKTTAVIHALTEGGKSKSGPTLEKKLAAARAKVEHLERILSIFDATRSQIKLLESDLNAIESQEEQLTIQRSQLGIFSGKEKKRIDEELAAISAKKSDLEAQINKNQKKIDYYEYDKFVKSDLADARKNASTIETQVEGAKANAGYEYSFKEAWKIYLRESDVTAAVNSIYRATSKTTEITERKDTVYFGKYVQEEKGSPEPIEWLVLEKDKDKVLLISRYALDYQPYNSSKKDVTWETCSLRKWLNGRFINTAFSSEEKGIIKNTTVRAHLNKWHSTSPGKNTVDKVFLLSMYEAENYFKSDSDRKCEATAYAESQGIEVDYNNNCYWWLRTPGFAAYAAAVVGKNGSINDSGAVNSDGYPYTVAVRPAMWVSI